MRPVGRLLVFGLVLLTVVNRPPPAVAQYESIVSQTTPAVVFIVVEKPGISSFGGSGFFIDPNGYVLTARHVIEGASRIAVRTSEGRLLDAKVVNYSTVIDVAVLKVDGTGYPVLHLGDSNSVRQGQEILSYCAAHRSTALCGPGRALHDFSHSGRPEIRDVRAKRRRPC
jgi:S1-C subfamily serine protease